MKRKIVLIISVLAAVILMGACSSDQSAVGTLELRIHDSVADVVPVKKGAARLIMDGIITNNSELRTAKLIDLPQLTMDGRVVNATYEPLDSEDKDKVKPGKSLCYHISYKFDPSEKHKWKFQSSDGSVVSGLDDYVCIKKALRNYKGKSQVTIDEVKKIEKEQKKRFKKFLKEEKK